jgi:hypothetical protein
MQIRIRFRIRIPNTGSKNQSYDFLLFAVLWMCIGFNADLDRDLAFFLNVDPDPGPGSQTSADLDLDLSQSHKNLIFYMKKNILKGTVAKFFSNCANIYSNTVVTVHNSPHLPLFSKERQIRLQNFCISNYTTTFNIIVPLTLALLNLPKGKSLGRSKPATNS